ncbi:MAG TPA: hypothetical protein VIF15_00970 [Polyangiaceae bacterium]|jgi:hypothetical protein
MRTAIRALVAAGGVAGAMLVAPQADAASYNFDVAVDTVRLASASNQLKSFQWGDPNEVSFTRQVDQQSVSLLQLAASHKETSATLHVTYGNAQPPPGPTTPTGPAVILTLQLSGVHVFVHQEGSISSTDALPNETVVLRAEKIVATYQTVTVTGQRLGPPVTVTFGHDNH